MIWDKEELRLELIALFHAISDSSGLENMRRPNKSQLHPAWQTELQPATEGPPWGRRQSCPSPPTSVGLSPQRSVTRRVRWGPLVALHPLTACLPRNADSSREGPRQGFCFLTPKVKKQQQKDTLSPFHRCRNWGTERKLRHEEVKYLIWSHMSLKGKACSNVNSLIQNPKITPQILTFRAECTLSYWPRGPLWLRLCIPLRLPLPVLYSDPPQRLPQPVGLAALCSSFFTSSRPCLIQSVWQTHLPRFNLKTPPPWSLPRVISPPLLGELTSSSCFADAGSCLSPGVSAGTECALWRLSLWGLWLDNPDPRVEAVSPALAGGIFTTESPEKPPYILVEEIKWTEFICSFIQSRHCWGAGITVQTRRWTKSLLSWSWCSLVDRNENKQGNSTKY